MTTDQRTYLTLAGVGAALLAIWVPLFAVAAAAIGVVLLAKNDVTAGLACLLLGVALGAVGVWWADEDERQAQDAERLEQQLSVPASEPNCYQEGSDDLDCDGVPDSADDNIYQP